MMRNVALIGLSLVAGCGAVAVRTTDRNAETPALEPPERTRNSEAVPFAATWPVYDSAAAPQEPAGHADEAPNSETLTAGPEPNPPGPQMLDDFLNVLLDQLILETVEPVGPQLDDTTTYLEQLCIDLDQPEHFCRRRYGR